MKKITYLILMFTIISCQKEDIDATSTPAYLEINNITLDDGTPLPSVTDAWVYVNDQLQGVYELPAKFPVLEEGVQTLRLRAGIKANGIASNRIYYPFYNSYFEDVNFTPNETRIISPTTNYLENAKFEEEDFEGNSEKLAITPISDVNYEKLTENSNSFAFASLSSDTLFTFEIASEELENLPQAGAPVFLELDYKCNTRFLVGVYINYPQSVVQKDLLWISPKEDWNKIYVNLTSTISEGIGATSFKVFVGMKRDPELDENKLSFDNFKVVY